MTERDDVRTHFADEVINGAPLRTDPGDEVGDIGGRVGEAPIGDRGEQGAVGRIAQPPGLRNLPCSTVNAQTEKSMGARFCSRMSASRRVTESLPPERPTATRSPSRIILNRAMASPTFRRIVFCRSKSHYRWRVQTTCPAV